MSAARPEVGAWYQTVAGDYLEVVAYDPDEGTIEIQHFDGAVEEYDEDSWDELVVRSAEPPEDWSGSLDIERQDYGVDLEENFHLGFENPLDTFDER